MSRKKPETSSEAAPVASKSKATESASEKSTATTRKRTSRSEARRRTASESPEAKAKQKRTSAEAAEFFSENILKAAGLERSDWVSLQKLTAQWQKAETDRVIESRKIIQKKVIDATQKPDFSVPLAFAESGRLLSGYATLDDLHRSEIKGLMKSVNSYLQDNSRKRPFNVLMLAAPGAGKSHFIRQLAIAMSSQRVAAVTFNMATMHSPDDMSQPIDELRNLKVNDHFPLLFLDEFDSDPAKYTALLPLLWDGKLHIGHRNLKLGKAMIVLAGSSPSLPETMVQAAQMQLEPIGGSTKVQGKMVDLLSRINGGTINIPDLDLRTGKRDRRVDKVCIAVQLFKKRFKGLTSMPRFLLRFIAHTSFRYGARSIAHLVDVVAMDSVDSEPEGKVMDRNQLGLPFESEATLQNSSLTLHLLDKDGGFGIVNRWKEYSRDTEEVSLATDSVLWDLITSPSMVSILGK